MNFRIDRFTLAGFAALLSWGAASSILRSLIEKIGGIYAATTVQGVAGALGLVILLSSGRLLKSMQGSRLHHKIICGVLLTTYLLCLYTAFEFAKDREQSQAVGLANYLWPVFSLLLTIPILGYRARWHLLIPGVVITVSGLMLAGSEGWRSWEALGRGIRDNPVSFILASCGAVSWGLYSNLSRRLGRGSESGVVFVYMLTTSIALSFLTPCSKIVPKWSTMALTEIMIIGLFSAIGYFLWDVAMKRGQVIVVITASYFMPAIYMVISTIYLGTKPSLSAFAGMALLIIGALLSKKGVLAPTVK